jgi:hypothetical protein
MVLADNAEKCNMFGNYLRGPAAVIWEGMEFYGESKVDWNSIKKYFLKEYQGEVDVETFTFKIAKLIQGSNKSAVNSGGGCLQSVYEQYKSIPVPAADALNADGAAVTAAGKLVTDITARSLFLTGLKENLRTLTMQKTIVNLREAINAAAKKEKLLKNKNELKGRIAVLADMEDEELEDQELDEDTVSRSTTPELVKENNHTADSTTSKEINSTDKVSDLEVPTATRTGTSRTEKTGNVVTAMPRATCKPNVKKESRPELLWLTETANLSEETTKEFVKLNQKKQTTCWDTSNNLLDKVVVSYRIKII